MYVIETFKDHMVLFMPDSDSYAAQGHHGAWVRYENIRSIKINPNGHHSFVAGKDGKFTVSTKDPNVSKLVELLNRPQVSIAQNAQNQLSDKDVILTSITRLDLKIFENIEGRDSYDKVHLTKPIKAFVFYHNRLVNLETIDPV